MKKLVNISSRFQGFLAETMPHLRPLKPTALRWILVGVLLQTSACSKLAARRTTTLKALHDESQALTTAVVDTLQPNAGTRNFPMARTQRIKGAFVCPVGAGLGWGGFPKVAQAQPWAIAVHAVGMGESDGATKRDGCGTGTGRSEWLLRPQRGRR